MPAKKTAAQKTAAQKTTKASSEGFTTEERSAMKDRAKEVNAGRRSRTTKSAETDGDSAVLAKIAEMEPSDRAMATRVHEVVMAAAPHLTPRLWYGMPAYAKDGKVLCFFQNATKFKTRYATFGFNDVAMLDDGTLWPVAYALTSVTTDVEKRIGALVTKAAG